MVNEKGPAMAKAYEGGPNQSSLCGGTPDQISHRSAMARG